ncbi:hypothetical protein ElyMa_004902200 [Elysia marginata]|uniref:Uncharacterized protein n=1 Tax=Elysia marginata TaxID=1093978 RepID=A0AAV4J095_9GAST|nr:hypothetical protein ElyMa_004902200 [Elysia marginata]
MQSCCGGPSGSPSVSGQGLPALWPSGKDTRSEIGRYFQMLELTSKQLSIVPLSSFFISFSGRREHLFSRFSLTVPSYCIPSCLRAFTEFMLEKRLSA